MATRRDIEAWRNRLVNSPITVKRHQDDSASRLRAPSTVNRNMAALRAALNYAYQNNEVSSDVAWRLPLRAIRNAGGRRELYLDKAQRRALIDHAAPDIALFIRCMALLPLRPGALASLTVGQFNPVLGVLTVGKDKRGSDRRIKMPEATAQVLAMAAGNRLKTEPLLLDAKGKAWNKDSWKGHIKSAALAAGLNPGVCAYTLRHSVITDLVTDGLDLLSVAQISGTSVAMIEKHYGHMRAEHAAAALDRLVL